MKFGIGLNITVYTAYHFGAHQLSVATVLLHSFGCASTHFMYCVSGDFFLWVLKMSEM
jgi:hypothetical protein